MQTCQNKIKIVFEKFYFRSDEHRIGLWGVGYAEISWGYLLFGVFAGFIGAYLAQFLFFLTNFVLR